MQLPCGILECCLVLIFICISQQNPQQKPHMCVYIYICQLGKCFWNSCKEILHLSNFSATVQVGLYVSTIISSGRGMSIQIHMHIYVEQQPWDNFTFIALGNLLSVYVSMVSIRNEPSGNLALYWRKPLVFVIKEYIQSLRYLLQPWNTIIPSLVLPKQICAAYSLSQRT